MSAARRHLRPMAEDGFTLVELMVAVLLLTVGILTLGTVISQSRGEASVSETKSTEIHRAQKEIERLTALPYASIAMSGAPVTSSVSTDPGYYVNVSSSSTCPTYRYDQTGTNAAEPLAVNGCAGPPTLLGGATTVSTGTVSPTPTPTNDGRKTYTVYDYVTWVTDPSCGVGCPSSADYKRLTVAVTSSGGSSQANPVLISTLIADPRANPANTVLNGNANPLANPVIQCLNSSGVLVTCTTGVGSSTVNRWYLTDSSASGSYSAPSANNTTRPTVAPFGLCTVLVTVGCPVPDLLNSAPPSGTASLFNYSSEQTGVTYPGGRVLHRDVSCTSTPSSTDNTKGEMWVTAPLGTSTTFTGQGGMTLNTQTISGVSASVTLCVAIYDVPGSILNLVALPPIKLGVVSYTLASWPTVSTPLSFTFNFSGNVAVSVPGVDRIGVRVWVAAASGADVAAIYDNPQFVSDLQLESQ
jgi:prepilin-type N-terminal cleavage/methylation domain-containing protein